MTKKRIGTMAACLALVGAVAVGGTLALLSTQSNSVTNTFTVGSGYPEDNALVLDEAKVDQVTSGTDNFGGYEATDEPRVPKNDYNNLVAGTTLDKDPTFHLAVGSPDSWIIAKVVGVDLAVADGLDLSGTLPEGYDWAKLNTVDGTVTTVDSYTDLTDGYYVTTAVVAGGTSTDALFEELTVGDDIDRVNYINDIVISGVAVEAVTDKWAQDGAAVVAQAKDAGFIK